ncbi:Adenine phosphoribosyl transferase 1 isoform 1 [Hibiscus syriacus]|uniref:Adenine phosphoribosyl transferase 1 isoform 1 n=1 Tax=Hibiscus syriacus TaxID=106335 RepID=A0A6A3CX78_HIBSY|nr:Adenine phosphoribosyl transferase 1 isoform 1 [Hibiscus syriacus]
MESLAVFHDEDWDSFNRMSSNEEGQLDFMHRILHQFPFPPVHDDPSTFCPESSWSTNSSSSVFVPQLNHETCFLSDSNHIAVTNGITMSLDISTDIDGWNKNRKNNLNGNEESNIGGDGQSCSTSSSDDDNVSQAINLNGKRRTTSRGSATDPQNLYARERFFLPILRVDISTMLEDAELWMYAPIAYNGVDIGLNKNICTLL